MSTPIYNTDLHEGQTKDLFIKELKKAALDVDSNYDQFTLEIFGIEIYLDFKDNELIIIV